MTKQEKRARLIARYRKMKSDQRHALDKTIRDLAALPTLPVRTVSPGKVNNNTVVWEKGKEGVTV